MAYGGTVGKGLDPTSRYRAEGSSGGRWGEDDELAWKATEIGGGQAFAFHGHDSQRKHMPYNH